MKHERVVRYDDGIDVGHLDCFVRRLVHPRTTGSVNIATSVAIIEPGQEIKAHSHQFEEAYFVVQGQAKMRIGKDDFNVGRWDSVYVPPEMEHWTLNTGREKLVLVCSLSPPPEFTAQNTEIRSVHPSPKSRQKLGHSNVDL